jgi:nicotinamidase-related amidase
MARTRRPRRDDPARCIGAQTAILLVDLINPFDFPGADALLPNAMRIAEPIQRLRRKARRAGAHVIYVNDNFGDWHHGLAELVESSLSPENPGRDFIAATAPEPDDYYVLKPRHSGFLSTSLDALIRYLGVDTVVICGIATEMCVLFTAIDAYMRELRVVVPRDCVASEHQGDAQPILALMADVLKATVCPADAIRLEPGATDASRGRRLARSMREARTGQDHDRRPAADGRVEPCPARSIGPGNRSRKRAS